MTHYLDFAATSAVRPPAVAQAIGAYVTECGATPGKGIHALAMEAGRIALRCRRVLTGLLGVPGPPTRLAFTANSTHALNMALWGTLAEDDVVVVTTYEHNAVLRPVHALSRKRGVEARLLGGTPDGGVDLREAAELMDGAKLVVLNAASNVLGTTLPVAELVELAHQAGALTLVDAAQSLGHVELDGGYGDADMIALTGHKGLLGPQGTGALWIREGLDVEPFFAGGGGDSLARDMPAGMPDRLEVGTLNGPGIAGLLAGCKHVLDQGVDRIHAHEGALKARLRDGLSQIPGLRLLSPAASRGTGIVTVRVDGVDAGTLADRMNKDFGVMTRAGLHCAPEVHRMLGTAETGAVRLSVGWSSTDEDVDAAIAAVDALAGRTAVAVGR